MLRLLQLPLTLKISDVDTIEFDLQCHPSSGGIGLDCHSITPRVWPLSLFSICKKDVERISSSHTPIDAVVTFEKTRYLIQDTPSYRPVTIELSDKIWYEI